LKSPHQDITRWILSGTLIGILLSLPVIMILKEVKTQSLLTAKKTLTTGPEQKRTATRKKSRRVLAQKPARAGLLTFRGNATRSYYGDGPVPKAPKILWRYPERPMCANSSTGGKSYLWCGTGWTGQPAVFEVKDKTWLSFGAYDRKVHFVDATTGKPVLRPVETGDIIKGSVTIDPDGWPLAYIGSRDGYYRIIAFDGGRTRTLYKLSAHATEGETMWNDDWDGAGLIKDDRLYIGGENSRFHVLKLNRKRGSDGLVNVKPEIVFHAPSWDRNLLRAVGDRNMSIENSVSMSGHTVWFANSGGLVQGWDVSRLKRGGAARKIFSFWTGDDTDSSVVVDENENLYVASELERYNRRSREVGQLMRLDPKRKDNPLVWSVRDRGGAGKSGFWATPALYKNIVIAASHHGRLIGVDRESGRIHWEMKLKSKTWQSPVVIDDVLIQGDCSGVLNAWKFSRPERAPKKIWQLNLGSCIESTPAVWKGKIYVGTRGGFMYALGD
jgi:outer membrane protein assembly factor BamB